MNASIKALIWLPLSGSALVGSVAAAQQPEAHSAVPPRPIDTPADRFGFIEGEQLQVSAGPEEGNLTFRIALPTGPSMASRFSLTASTPIHNGEDAKPASLDAFANGTRVKLTWGYFDLRVGRPDEIAERLRARARERCRRAEPATDTTTDPCNNSAYAMHKYDPANVGIEQRRSGPGANDFGVDATIGFNDFEWLDRTALVPIKQRRSDWGVAAHFAHYFAGTQTAFTASAAYQRAYEAAKEQLVCPPAATDPATQCKTARIAAPARNTSFLLSAGLRHRFTGPDGKLLNFAVAPLVTYDVKNDVWGVDVPVYVIPGKEGALNGGIRFGYRSDRTDKFTVGVFVGTNFNILQ